MSLNNAGVGRAQENLPKAVIVAKNANKNTVTIQILDTGQRHTYFLTETTRLLSQDTPTSFDDIAAGQAVALDFLPIDLGRELRILRIPQLDQRLDNELSESDEVLYVSGAATGVRPIKRTITIQGPRLTQRMTLHIPASVRIELDQKPIAISAI